LILRLNLLRIISRLIPLNPPRRTTRPRRGRGCARGARYWIIAVAHQSAVFDEIPDWMHCRQPASFSELENLLAISIENRTQKHKRCITTAIACLSERSLNVF